MDESFVGSGVLGEEAILRAPGFVRRLLLRNVEQPGTFYYVSMWDSLEDLERYRASPQAAARVRYLAEKDLFAAPIERFECELVFDEKALVPGSGRDRV